MCHCSLCLLRSLPPSASLAAFLIPMPLPRLIRPQQLSQPSLLSHPSQDPSHPSHLYLPPFWSRPSQDALPYLPPPQKLSPATVREFRAEVSIMSRLRHPNVVLFMVGQEGRVVLFIVGQEGGRGGETEARWGALDDLSWEARGYPGRPLGR